MFRTPDLLVRSPFDDDPEETPEDGRNIGWVRLPVVDAASVRFARIILGVVIARNAVRYFAYGWIRWWAGARKPRPTPRRDFSDRAVRRC